MASNKSVSVEMGDTSDNVRITSNPMVADWKQSPRAAAAAPAPRAATSSRAKLVIAVLVITNMAAIAAAVVFAVRYSQTDSKSVRPSTQAVFSAGHADAAVAPAASFLSNSRSDPHFQRHVVTYKGTSRENTTVAAGINRILHSESGEPLYDVHTEIFTNGAFGEYASPSGAVGNRALRMRIIELATGVEVILIPHSLSMVRNVTLVPNHYFFSYLAPGGETVATHVSTIVPGRVVMFGDIGGAEWTSFMPNFFKHYEASWLVDHPEAASRRRLGFGSWAAGKVGGWIGGEVGGDAGRDIGADAGKSMYGGESVGGSIGGAVGGHFGAEAGGAIGEDVGAAAGGALGTAIGGPVGGFIGEEVGGWAGRKVGSDIGQHVGDDIGTHLGDDVEGDIDRWM